jgi:hypothetical protein
MTVGSLQRSCSVLVALAVGFWAMAQPPGPPALRCASVNVSGDVTLTWTPPTDPDGLFQEYRIYRADSPFGPFVQLPTTVAVFGQTTFPDLGAAAQSAPRYYYMTTVSDVPPLEESAPSDTISTLFLDLAQSVPAGSAVLSWEVPLWAPTVPGPFTIWMEYPIGTWSQIGTAPLDQFNYAHIISICEDSLTFRIGLADQLGCVSFSNLVGDVFADVTPPSIPVLVAATVDTSNGLSGITWQPSPELDTDGYIVVWNTPGGGVIIDTIYGQNNTVYTWPSSLADQGPESFTVASFDTCQVGEPPSPNTSATGPAHTTVHVSTSYDRCAARMTLEWTPYGGWEVATYRVFVQVDGGPWNLLANVPGDQFTHVQDVVPFRNYCYVVKSIQEGGSNTSLSNKVCRRTDYPPIPGDNYIRSVSVTGPTQITLIDSVDVTSQAGSYLIERSANGGPYEAMINFPGTAGPLITWVDTEVDPSTVGYLYRVAVLDSCGVEATTSNIAGNMLLSAVPDLYGVNTLRWNGYAEWAGTVGVYTIYRSIADGPFEPLAVVAEPTWSYVDDVSAYTATTGRFCYYVEAQEVGSPVGINASSLSNVACAVQQDLVYIPNAFIVGGANPVFIPVLSFVDISDYELSIINRWGQVIWTSNDPATGWNGVVGSNTAPIGVYGYYCTFSTGDGRVREERGTVTLLTAGD